MRDSPQTSVLYHVSTRGLSRRALLEFARNLEQEITAGHPFCCLVTSDDELRQLNKEFLKKDYATDVLSFPNAGEDGSIGELAISWDRAKVQAAEYGHEVEDEMQILMLHGVLHLIGLDHEKDRGRMARVEMRWRKFFKLPTGLIERVRS